jgi:hypothetical protein
VPFHVTAARGVPLYLAWLGALTVLLLASLSEALPWRLTFLTPDRLHGAVVQLQLFLALAVAPFLAAGAVHAPVLAALGLPFAAAAAAVSATPWGTVLLAQLLLVPPAGLALRLHGRRPRAYAAGLLVLAAVLPFAAFVAAEFAAVSLSLLRIASPFWALSEPVSAAAVVHAGLCAGALGALELFRRRAVDAAAPAG